MKETFRTMSLQPALLLTVIVEIAVLAFLILGVRFEFERETLISLKILRSEIGEVTLFLQKILPTFVSFLSTVLMFLLIVGTSGLYTQLLEDPLLGVMLTKPLPRSKLFVSKYVGMIQALSANIVAFSVFTSVILSIKNNGSLIVSPVIGSFSFVGQFVVISALCSLFAMLTESMTAVAVLGLAVYFVLGPMLSSIEKTENVILIVISCLIPHTGNLMTATQNLLLGKQADLTVFPPALLLAFAYFAVASVLFNRRDL